MAGGGRLTTVRPSLRLAALAAMVLVLHFATLHWLAEAMAGPPLLKTMSNPMFTRLLQQEAAPVPVAAATPTPKKKRSAIAATKAAKPGQPAASEPEPEPAIPPQAAASAPEPAASEPVAAASAPQPPASAAIVLAADTWPVDTRLNYRLTGWYDGELTGTARVQWLRQEDRYETRVDLDLGIFGMQFLSQGDVSPDSLSPRAYQETRPGRVRAVQLGPENVTLNDGRVVPKPPGAQDTASHFVELSHRFSTGKEKLVVGGHTSMWIARPGGVDLWDYDIVAIDQLPTPRLGTVPAYHLKPRPIADSRGDIYAEVWIAPTLQYLPIRIKITQGPQRYVDITVDHIEQR